FRVAPRDPVANPHAGSDLPRGSRFPCGTAAFGSLLACLATGPAAPSTLLCLDAPLRSHGGLMARPSRTRPPQGRRTLRATAALDAPAEHAADATHPGVRPAAANSLPPEVARRAQREMDRLRRLPTG